MEFKSISGHELSTFDYIHLLWLNDTKFYRALVSILTCESNGLDAERHCFVSPFGEVISSLEGCRNVYLLNDSACNGPASFINDYGDFGKLIFIHAPFLGRHVLRIKSKYLGKIVWRSWGGRLFYEGEARLSAKKLAKAVLTPLARRKLQAIRAFGIGNMVDQIDLERQIGHTRFYRLNYPGECTWEIREGIASEVQAVNRVPRVLIGHSGYTEENHFKIVDRLALYEEKDAEFLFLLPYGDKTYIKQLKRYAAEKLGLRAIFIEDMKPIENYLRFLNSVDIAILDATCSTGLGCFCNLLFFKKKIFVNKAGLYYEALRRCNLPVFASDEIGRVSWDELLFPPAYPDDYREKDLLPQPYTNAVNCWRRALNELACNA